MKLKKEQVNEWLDNPKRLLIGGAVVGIGGFFLYKLGRKIITDIRSQNTEKLADDSAEVRQAMAMKSAMNPSGASWMQSFDTTNTPAVFETTKQITKMDEVIAAYKKLYDSDLMKDLQSELSTEDYQKFLTMISTNNKKVGGNVMAFAKKGQMIVAKQVVSLRSTPDATYKNALSPRKNNIIKRSIIGEFLGYATGNQFFDDKNNVKFIEVAYLIKKEGLPVSLQPYAGKKYSYWVSSSSDFVEMFSYFDQMFQRYPATSKEVTYKKPLDFYKGVSGYFTNPVITTHKTKILDNKMQPFISVESSTLLGEYLMSLNTGKASFIKFRTVDNTERWVNSNDVILKN